MGVAGALLAASCAGTEGPPPAQPPSKCPEATSSAAPAPSVATTAAPSAIGSASPAASAPKATVLDLNSAPSRAKLLFAKVAVKSASQSAYSVVPRATGGAWLFPEWPRPKDGLFLAKESGAAKEAWSARADVQLYGARDGADGAWMAAAPTQRGDFGFSHLERVFRLGADGRVAADHPFDAGKLKPRAAGSDGAGNLYVAGTLAGPLKASRNTVVPDAGGRAEVLVKILPAGTAEWVAMIPASSGKISTMTVSLDGSALVVSSPLLGEQVLTAFAPDGKVTFEKKLVPFPPANFPIPAVEAVVSDGKGGYFAKGTMNEAGGIDFGLGPLAGDGTFLVRLDAKGQALWEKDVKHHFQLVGDGAGSVVLLSEAFEEKLAAVEIDGAGRVLGAEDIDLPNGCRPPDHSVSITLSGGLTTSYFVVLMTCQPQDDRYMPTVPLGKPALFIGTVSRH